MPQAYAALIANGHVLVGRKSMVNVAAGWTNVANGGYQWGLPGGRFDLVGPNAELQAVPANWHVCPPGPAPVLQAIHAAQREFEEETGLLLDRVALDVAVHVGPASAFYLVTFTVHGPAGGMPYTLLTNYVAAYTALAQPLALALCNPGAVGAVGNVRAQWVNGSALRAPGPHPVGCAGFCDTCDFEFSELTLLQLGNTGGHLGQPQTYTGTGAEENHILSYALFPRRATCRPMVRYTLRLVALPVGPGMPGVPTPAQNALGIDWYVTMAGWL